MSEFPDDLPERPEPVNQPPAKHDWGFDVYLCRTKGDERKYLNTVAELREHLMACLSRRETVLTFELPVMAWMAFCDEIEQHRPKNYSALLRDDAIDRLNAAIERVHEEVLFMVASGPAPLVAARMDPRRTPGHLRASPELQRTMRDKGEPQ